MDYEQKVLTREVEITSAQLKALVATDVELVEAPGANKVIELLGAILTLIPNASPVAYTWANTDHDILIGGNTIGGDTPAQALIESSTRIVKQLVPANKTLTENAALKLEASGTGEPAAGNGTLRVKVMYAVHDITQ